MTLKGAPFVPEVDSRMSTDEATQVADEANITTLTSNVAALQNGTLSPALAANSETITASGAASISKLLTILDGTTNASTVSLAAPAADGQFKFIKLGVSAANHPTISGTNIVTAAGVSKSGTVGTFTSITAGSVSFLSLYSLGGVWVILGTNVTFA